MPISLTGIDAGSTQYGIGSYFAMADRTAAAAGGDVTDVDDFHKIRYNFQSFEMAGNAPGIEIPIIGNSPSAFPTQAGPLDIINGFTIPAFTSQLEPIFRQLLNDSRELDTGATGPPSATQVGGRLAAQSGIATGFAVTVAPKTGTPPTGITNPTRAARLLITQTTGVAGTLTLVGTDANEEIIRESIAFDGTDTSETTTRWFATITSISATAAMSIGIVESSVAVDRPFVSEFFGRSDARLLFGADFFSRKGTVPNTLREVFIDTFSFSISREGAIAYTVGCVGKRPFEHRWIDGATTTEPTDTGASAESFYRNNGATFPFVRRESFTGWQGGLFYRAPGATSDSRLPLIDATVTISNNLAFSPTITGRRTPGDAFRNRRTVTLDGTMEYVAEDSDLIADVLAGEFLEGTYLRLQNASSGGFPYQSRYDFGRLQFTNVPSATVAEEGLITRRAAMASSDSADGSRPDIRIRTQVLSPLALAEISL